MRLLGKWMHVVGERGVFGGDIMKVGDLVKFDYVNGHTRDINNKSGIFLGERPPRVPGATLPNFAVLLLGEYTERLCDAGLKRWLKVIK